MEKVGLCLSGGGAKGAAHIGVIKALEEAGINIDYISGTSSGSIVASLYAAGYSPLQILSIFKSYGKYITSYDKLVPFKIIGMLFTGKFKLKSFVKGEKLECVLRKFLTQKKVYKISDVKKNLAIPTVDINTGEIIYFLNKKIKCGRNYDDIPSCIYDADLASIVRASSSFPFVFSPKCIDNKNLVDGGIRINSAVSILKKMGATKVITVHFENNTKYNDKDMNVISVTMQTFDIMGHEINKDEIKLSDYIINVKLNDISLLDYSKINYVANVGYNLTKNNIDVIKKAIE